ncbi:TetR/AcrR family transcriptional regulator [Nocardia sp. NPDC056100]|uniref:TetR/AcrR family transcriptional regulator n=1 Tax=Nocardia sp. NPDC056100 TaxID=3345712 RepID=UPI0035E2AEAE
MAEQPIRLRADAQRNRDRLLAAAGEVIGEAGAEASLEEIARRAGVGSATLHRHFPSRAALLGEVLHTRVQALCDRSADLLTAPDAGDALVLWIRDVVAHAATARGLGPALTGYHSAPEFEPHTMIRQAVRPLLERAHREGVVDPTVTVEDLLHLANGIALATESLPDPARRADALIALVARGLLR